MPTPSRADAKRRPKKAHKKKAEKSLTKRPPHSRVRVPVDVVERRRRHEPPTGTPDHGHAPTTATPSRTRTRPSSPTDSLGRPST
jgi:hypothetical protein